MNEVVLDGVPYVKAATAAKQFRYTTDYIGQLCRAKKIDARLVGRAWFVNLDSVIKHKRSRHVQKVAKSSGNDDVANKTKPSRINVLPVVRNKTAKSVLHKSGNSVIEISRKLKVFYEADDEQLIPRLIKKHYAPAKVIPVNPAEAKKIKTEQKSSLSTFVSTKIPEVSLSGKLQLTSYPDFTDERSAKPTGGDKGVLVAPKKESVTHEDLGIKGIQKSSKKNKTSPSLQEFNVSILPTEQRLKDANNSGQSKYKFSQIIRHKPKHNTVPVSDKAKAQLIPVQKSAKLQVKQPLTLVLVSPLVATLLALLCAVILFSAETVTVVTESSHLTQVVFKLDSLLNKF